MKLTRKPVLEEHEGYGVVRDDLFPGGTKARFIPELFEHADEVVYATPAQGGAQYALAFTAHRLGKRATLFVAKRKVPHPRQLEAKALGAKIVMVPFGMLSNVQAQAKRYAEETGATLAPFGMDMPRAIELIAAAARSLNENPDEVWCAAGSGTLCRALHVAWPRAHHVAVAVGRNIPPDDVAHAELIRYPKPFEHHALTKPPFPADPHYEAKAWEIMRARSTRSRRVIFWSVCAAARVPEK